jgi:hypothetical protein
MRNTMKTLIKILLGTLGVVLVVAIAIAGYLIYPGTPSSASSLIFQGYVPLPSDSALSVLDYFTVRGDELFVTNETTGYVYRIQIHKDALPTAADVARLAGEPAAHGVVIEPSSHLAFVTRSEANTVDIFDPAKMTVIKRIPVANDPDAIFYDEFARLIYVASGDSHVATLIDPSTQAALGTIPLQQGRHSGADWLGRHRRRRPARRVGPRHCPRDCRRERPVPSNRGDSVRTKSRLPLGSV